MNHTHYAALGSPERLRIVKLCRTPRYVHEINARIGTTQPNTSQQLRKLKDAGMVIAKREGRFIRYSTTKLGVKMLGVSNG